MEEYRFGLFTDIQYADRPKQIGRYYRNALKKANTCIDFFNHAQLDFCVHLGDMIDWPGDPTKGCEALRIIMPVMNKFDGSMYYLLGNHDVHSVPRADLSTIWGMRNGQTWYSFDHKGIHFVALDCNFDAENIPYRPGTAQWDQCYVPDCELEWLQDDLRETKSGVVVVMVHALLDDIENPHVIRNAEKVRKILENCNKQVIVFQGHMHTGYESIKNGIGYYTLPSIVDGRTRICFWIIEVGSCSMTALIYDSAKKSRQPKKRVLLKW